MRAAVSAAVDNWLTDEKPPAKQHAQQRAPGQMFPVWERGLRKWIKTGPLLPLSNTTL